MPSAPLPPFPASPGQGSLSGGPGSPARPWSARWSLLAQGVGIREGEPLIVALSGGADSVLLMHLLAAAEPRPVFRAVHVDHGLRGCESSADADFCARLCRSLEVPLIRRAIQVDPDRPNLEARCRLERYRVLCEEARRAGFATILTGHHADDVLETLLMRWVRGTSLAGLPGLRPRIAIAGRTIDRNPDGLELSGSTGSTGPADPIRHPAAGGECELDPVSVVRPLIHMRRGEVRRLLRDRGLPWREDSSNRDRRFTRNRIRNRLLPMIERMCGDEGVANLFAFGRAVESFEDQLAGETVHLSWGRPPFADASRGPDSEELGGSLSRGQLMRLPAALRRRALWRLLTEGSGRSPGRRLLGVLLADLAAGRCTRHTLPGRWVLLLRSKQLQLLPPDEQLRGRRATGADARQDEPGPHAFSAPLELPGSVTLPDGRRIQAELVLSDPGAPIPRSPALVELDADDLPADLSIRWPRRGDRFHPLGAPGSKGLRRFLADVGIPREERQRVPLVCSGHEVLWVAGVRPNESRRIQPRTRRRMRLTLQPAARPLAV